MQRRVITFATVIGTAGAFMLAACTDEPTRPSPAPPEPNLSLSMSAEDRGRLQAAMLFARANSMIALDRREAADRVAAALAAVADRVERDDRSGLEKAMATARKAIDRYRAIAGAEDASAIDLDAVTLSLDHAASLIREADTALNSAGARARTQTPKEHQP